MRESRLIRQLRVADWCRLAFGAEQQSSVPQRGIRLLEEAIECAQAAGCERAMAHKLVDYVFDRPAGELFQELGGVGVTVLALAAAADVSADDAEQVEVDRVMAKPLSHFTARNQAKNDAGFLVAKTEEVHVETCIGCEAPILHDAPAYYYRDGPVACESCAPTLAESIVQLQESIASSDDAEDKADWQQSIEGLQARIAAGEDPATKHVWRI